MIFFDRAACFSFMQGMLSFSSHNLLEGQSLRSFAPAVESSVPENYDHGIILASPHSGRVYPKAFTRRSALPIATLRRNEDAFMDQVIAPLYARGFPLLQAHFPRCFLDVNRAPDELLPQWVELGAPTTPRGAAGLGVVPTMIAQDLKIYKTPLPQAVVKGRLEQLYHPYHRALKTLLKQAQRRSGEVILLDCHSMPGVSFSGRTRHDIILGDRFGASSKPELMQITEQVFTQAGYRVARNYPYAGGYVTSEYGQPQAGVNVIQIEVNRQIYMNPASFKLTKGFDNLQSCFIRLAEQLRSHMTSNAVAPVPVPLRGAAE